MSLLGFKARVCSALFALQRQNVMYIYIYRYIYIPWDPPLVLHIVNVLIDSIMRHWPGSYLAPGYYWHQWGSNLQSHDYEFYAPTTRPRVAVYFFFFFFFFENEWNNRLLGVLVFKSQRRRILPLGYNFKETYFQRVQLFSIFDSMYKASFKIAMSAREFKDFRQFLDLYLYCAEILFWLTPTQHRSPFWIFHILNEILQHPELMHTFISSG